MIPFLVRPRPIFYLSLGFLLINRSDILLLGFAILVVKCRVRKAGTRKTRKGGGVEFSTLIIWIFPGLFTPKNRRFLAGTIEK